MFIFVILVVAILIALLRGGKIVYLADLNMKWRGLILVGFLIQILIFNNVWQNNAALKDKTALAYIFSLCLLMIALAKNHAISGMIIITFGFFLNAIAISLNGGYMPASLGALITAGMSPLAPGETNNNSIGVGPATLVTFLGDIFAIPKGFIFPNVFSIGDLIISIGAVYLLQKTMVKPKK
jgi:hypothetical protein